MIKLLLRSKHLALDTKNTFNIFSPAFFMLALVGCSSEDQSYFPLEEGHWREYQETLIIRDETQTRRRVVRNLASVTFDDQKLFVQEIQGEERQYFSVKEEGIFREDPEGNKFELILPLSSDKDESWSLASRLGVIESRTFARRDRILTKAIPITLTYSVISIDEEVVVPAGRFKNCLKVKGTGFTTVRVDRGNGTAEVKIESFDWYASGIGLIKTERTEQSNSSFLKTGFYTLELLRID